MIFFTGSSSRLPDGIQGIGGCSVWGKAGCLAAAAPVIRYAAGQGSASALVARAPQGCSQQRNTAWVYQGISRQPLVNSFVDV